jgi:hypothetical protein
MANQTPEYLQSDLLLVDQLALIRCKAFGRDKFCSVGLVG